MLVISQYLGNPQYLFGSSYLSPSQQVPGSTHGESSLTPSASLHCQNSGWEGAGYQRTQISALPAHSHRAPGERYSTGAGPARHGSGKPHTGQLILFEREKLLAEFGPCKYSYSKAGILFDQYRTVTLGVFRAQQDLAAFSNYIA